MSDDTIMELRRAREIVGWAYDAAKAKGDPVASKLAITISTLHDLAVQHGDHDCMEHAVQCTTDGPLGHGWECGRCGNFLQAG